MIVFILSIILLCLFLQYNWNRRRWYKLSWLLNGSYSFPIIGDGLKLMCKNEDILDEALSKVTNAYPSPVKFWFGPMLTVFFTEVQHVEKIISSVKFIQKGYVYRFLGEYIGEGLISSSGQKWKRDRRLITPYLTNKQIEKYFPCMVENSEILAKILERKLNKSKFDIKKYVTRCAADIVNETIAGVKSQAQEGYLDMFLKEIHFLYVHVHSRIAKFWLHNEFIYKLTGQKKLGSDAFNVVSTFFDQGLNRMKKIHDQERNLDDEEINKSILNRLLYIRDKIPDFATDEQLIHHLSTFYTAAEDTISIISSFSLTVFGMYPVIQDKIYKELHQIFGPIPRQVEIEDLAKLDYLKMCVKEILRLFPISPFIIRTAMEDYEIDKWVIPKGCTVAISIFNIHRDPNLWEKPDEFYPDHFLPSVASKRHPYAFIPFSAGPRGCVGKPYGYMAIYTILATLLQRYEFITEGKLQDKKLKADISIRYKDDDYSVKIVPRRSMTEDQ